MAKDLNQLVAKMLDVALGANTECHSIIVDDIMSFQKFYIVASPETTAEEWAQKSFAAYIINKKMVLFLTPPEAISFAIHHGAVLNGNIPMTVCSSMQTTAKIISTYAAKDLIDGVQVYSRAPLSVLCPIVLFAENAPTESGSMVMVDNTPDEIVPTASYQLVSEVKKVLDCCDVAERRKLDPALNYENLHSLIEKLLQANCISQEVLDDELELPHGFISSFCLDRVSNVAPKQVVVRLLEKFGIIEYLYQFKGQSAELAAEIKKNPSLDCYSIKPAKITTKERFKLIRIKRGHDNNGAYVYGLTMKSKKRSIDTIVSTPLSFILGKEYELGGLDPIMDESAELTAAEPAIMPSADEQAEILAKLEREEGKKHRPPAVKPKPTHSYTERQLIAPEYSQLRKNDIIKYFKRQRGDNFQAAEASFTTLAKYEDILDEFYQYIKNNKQGKLCVRDYTAKRLMALHYNPYDSYCMIAKLRDEPRETLQELKYRETDPQWQK